MDAGTQLCQAAVMAQASVLRKVAQAQVSPPFFYNHH
jgi:hypothetical protein